MLFFAFAVLARAEDFSWTWEKESKPPSERPSQEAGDKTAAVQPVQSLPVSPGRSSAAPKSVTRNSASVSPDSAGDNFMWAWEKEATKTSVEQGDAAGDGRKVKSKAGAASEKSRTTNAGSGAPKNEAEILPPEIEDLSGGVPRTDVVKERTEDSTAVLPPPRRPNRPSSPVVVPHPAEMPAVFPEAKKPATSPSQPVSTGAKQPSGQESRAYDELLKENLDLNKKIEDRKQDTDLERLTNRKLAREINDLEQKIAESVGKIKDLEKQKAAFSVSPAKLKVLEDRLNSAEQEKALLASQLARLQKKVASQSQASTRSNKPLTPVAGKPVDSVKVGSDLYLQLEHDNLLLKQKLAEIDAERQKAIKTKEITEKKEKIASEDAARALAAQKQMKDKLEEAKSAEKKQKKIMMDLAERIPDMEKELSALQKKISEKDSALKEKERNLEVLANEIHQRENRLKKAGKMVELLEQAQKDVSQVSDNEKRDMHYNMAAVYSQVGRYNDAEREYLNALKLDPADADIHYNLGILYDENLREKQKAAMHYRRYLKLKPNGSDVDSVKNWLLNIDMNK